MLFFWLSGIATSPIRISFVRTYFELWKQEKLVYIATETSFLLAESRSSASFASSASDMRLFYLDASSSIKLLE